MEWRASATMLRRGGPRVLDALLAISLLAAIELQIALSPSLRHPAPAAAAGFGLALVVLGRRRFPLVAIGGAVAVVAAQEAYGGRLTEHSLGALVAVAVLFYAAGAYQAERRAWSALGLGLAGILADVVIVEPSLAAIFFPTVFLALLPWSLGRAVREHRAGERAERDRAERLDAERDQRTLTATFTERARIARELHDVIAHSVSVMVIQAGGARAVMGSDLDAAAASLAAVERSGRDALAEMRRLLGVLGERGDPRSLAPQPGLGALDELVTRTRAAGLPTELAVEGSSVPIPAALDLCAYRIVQEALTNAVKHAGPARASISISWAPHSLEIEVLDDGCGSRGGARGGHGIAGMRERASLHGGTLHAGADPRGGFAVRAHLPLAAEVAA
jgi:signal transduction histidine kinase